MNVEFDKQTSRCRNGSRKAFFLRQLPAMEPFLIMAYADGGVEEIGEVGFCEEFFTRAIGQDAALLHEDNAVDFGEDIAEVVGDEDEPGAFLREAAHGVAELALGGQV